MPKTHLSRCGCCQLVHEFKFTESALDLCAKCRYHRSPEASQTLKRHQEHEEMLREHLARANAWAQRVAAENKKNKQDVYFAYRTRDRAADLLQKINDIHTMRPDGSCSCRIKKNCPTAEVIYKRFAQMLIKRVDAAQEELRRLQDHMNEMEALGEYGEEDDWIRDTAYGPSGVTRRDDVAG